jgi:TM2 domain-containing membrane protein YozV
MDRQQSMVAVGLEAGPGLLGFFGMGHMYSGRVGTGLMIMISYWVLQAINIFVLMPLLIGWITTPLTMLAYMVAAPTNVLSSRPRS